MLVTFPSEKLESMQKMVNFMSYEVHFNARGLSAKDPGMTCVDNKHLDEITNAAHDRCLICDDNCNRCKLGKAFDRVLLKDRPKESSWAFINIGEDEEEEK